MKEGIEDVVIAAVPRRPVAWLKCRRLHEMASGLQACGCRLLRRGLRSIHRARSPPPPRSFLQIM